MGRNHTWLQANELCIKLGGRLPVIQSAQENKDIYDLQVREDYKIQLDA